jgi:hypothetical protein
MMLFLGFNMGTNEGRRELAAALRGEAIILSDDQINTVAELAARQQNNKLFESMMNWFQLVVEDSEGLGPEWVLDFMEMVVPGSDRNHEEHSQVARRFYEYSGIEEADEVSHFTNLAE